MSKHCKGSNKHCFEMFGIAQVVIMKTAIKPVRNSYLKSEYSKSDDFKKLSLLAQILSF